MGEWGMVKSAVMTALLLCGLCLFGVAWAEPIADAQAFQKAREWAIKNVPMEGLAIADYHHYIYEDREGDGPAYYYVQFAHRELAREAIGPDGYVDPYSPGCPEFFVIVVNKVTGVVSGLVHCY